MFLVNFKKISRKPVLRLALSAIALWSGAAWTAEKRVASNESAAAVWAEMEESSLTREEIPLVVKGTSGHVTFGAEKEGSSYLITRVMSPNAELFREYVFALPEEKKIQFLRNFFVDWTNGKIRETPRDREGKVVQFPMHEFEGMDWSRINSEDLKKKFSAWLSHTDNSPFSFLTKTARRDIFKGGAFGLSGMGVTENRQYDKWVPIRGWAEKYIENAHNTGKGWEINFKPQDTYAEDEILIDWFRTSLKNAGQLFDAPGHQRIVFPKRLGEEKTDPGKMAEVYRNLQAYILLRSQEGQAGVEAANHKGVSSDQTLETSHKTDRDILRLEEDRFGKDTFAVEIRAGTKSADTRRFAKQAILSRYVSNDYSGLASVKDYQLIPYNAPDAEKIARRFGITLKSAEDFVEKIGNIKPTIDRGVDIQSIPALWEWENAPYLSTAKRARIRDLTRLFVTSVAEWKDAQYSDLQAGLASWAKSAQLSTDIENYLRPKPEVSSQELRKLLEFRPTRAGPVDVNTIDMGLEYTARYPIRSRSLLTEDNLENGRRAWLETQFDLSMEERKAVLSDIADKLGRELDPGSVPKLQLQGLGNHGHSLETAYEFKDEKKREWRVEWDGIGRDYTPAGDVIDGSLRGGHVEVVSPKFVPQAKELQAIHKAFADSSAIPSAAMGGGHINVDLAPFEGKPKQLARFAALVNENRGIMSLLFQDPRRLRSAEPVSVSESFAAKLANFDGSEEELKKLFYNERYFNTRVGRKTRYVQMDLSAYFQDVIPEEFIHQDFDIKNDLWRKNFDVFPEIRKVEFRMFNAPRTPEEGALQIKFVRALLHEAINSDRPISGKVEAVDYNKYLENPKTAMEELKQLCERLGLEFQEYRPMLLRSMSVARSVLQSNIYKPFEQQIAANPKVEGWGQAVAARSKANQVESEGRPWRGRTSVPEAKEILAKNQESRVIAERLREELDPSNAMAGVLRRQPASKHWLENKGLKDLAELHPVDKIQVIYANWLLKDNKVNPVAKKALEDLRTASEFEAALSSALLSPDKKMQNWASKFIQKEDSRLLGQAVGSSNAQVRERAYSLLLDKNDPVEFLEFLNSSEAANSKDAGVLKDYFQQAKKRMPKRLGKDLYSPFGAVIKNILNSLSSDQELLRSALGELKKGMISFDDYVWIIENVADDMKPKIIRLAAKETEKPFLEALNYLDSPNAEVRAAASGVLKGLVKTVRSPEAKIRDAAYRQVRRMGLDVLLTKLILHSKVLESKDFAAKKKAVGVLASISHYNPELDKAVFQKLVMPENLENPEMARAMAKLVKVSDSTSWAEWTDKFFSSKNPQLRASIFLTEGSEALDLLLFRALEDKDAGVRVAAEKYLIAWSDALGPSGAYYAERGWKRLEKLSVSERLKVFHVQKLFDKNNHGIGITVKNATSLLALPEVTPQMQRKWAKDLAAVILLSNKEQIFHEHSRTGLVKEARNFFETLTDPRARAELKVLLPSRKPDLKDLRELAKRTAEDPNCSAFFSRMRP